MIKILTLLLLCILVVSSYAQKTEVIYLENPSFEGRSRPGTIPEGWADCGQTGESPPDIQPYGGFNVTRPAKEGKTYLGLVTRDNKTWEAISQKMTGDFKKGSCYKFAIQACRSPTYISPTKKNQSVPVNFSKGVVLRIWGGTNYCERVELLDKIESPVEHFDWRKYEFEFRPQKGDYNFICIEAYYKTPTLAWYNGNILIDNASEIYSCVIPQEDPVIAAKDPVRTPDLIVVPYPSNTKPADKPNTSAEKLTLIDKGSFDFTKLKKEELKVGQRFRLEKLYFPADSAIISRNSKKELYNLYIFLRDNASLYVEIGGHTNGLPADEYCDKLSNARAENVAKYLMVEGIDKERIAFKGYGKRRPISDNKTALGRSRNQRVELIITDIR